MSEGDGRNLLKERGTEVLSVHGIPRNCGWNTHFITTNMLSFSRICNRTLCAHTREPDVTTSYEAAWSTTSVPDVWYVTASDQG